MNSDATSTISTPTPATTSDAQQYVTDATRLTSSSPTSRKMFHEEVAKRCLEAANQEKEDRRPVPKPRKDQQHYQSNHSTANQKKIRETHLIHQPQTRV